MEAPKIILLPIDSIKVPKGRRSISDEVVRELADSIQKRDLINPITVDKQRRLLAGAHRLAACKSLGWKKIPAHITNHKGVDAQLVEIDENLARNDLSALERAEQIVRRKRLYEKIHPKVTLNKGGRGNSNETVTGVSSFSKDAARKTNLSQRTILQDIQIASDIDKDVRAIIKKTPIADRKRDLMKLAREPIAEQRKIAVKLANGSARSLRDAKVILLKERRLRGIPKGRPLDESCKLLLGDFRKISDKIQNNSVSLLLCDPPYGKEYLHLYEDLGKIAARVLKPNGSLVVMPGQYFLPEVLQLLCPHLQYHWLFAVSYLGDGRRVFPKKVFTRWKPLVWFTKGKYFGEWTKDFVIAGGKEKELHEWQQAEQQFEDIILNMTKAGDTVFDPFLGSGTTGAVALKLGRKFVGMEINAKTFKMAERRIRAGLADKA